MGKERKKINLAEEQNLAGLNLAGEKKLAGPKNWRPAPTKTNLAGAKNWRSDKNYLDGNEVCTYLLLYLDRYTMSFPPLFFKRNELKKIWDIVHDMYVLYHSGGGRGGNPPKFEI